MAEFENVQHRPGTRVRPVVNSMRLADDTAASLNEGRPLEGREFLSPTKKRFVVSGSSSRYALPGQPGYAAKSDQPMGVVNTHEADWDHRDREIKYHEKYGMEAGMAKFDRDLNDYSVGGPRYMQPGQTQSWDTTIIQRTYNSPRFAAAIQDQAKADPQHWESVGDSAWKWTEEPDEDRKRYDSSNMERAKGYWKAHADVSSGKYDDIEDPFEDSVRMRDPRPKVNNNLSSQFKLVPGFVKL